MKQRRPAATRSLILCSLLLVAGGCASLGLNAIVQPPRFATADGRQSELRLLGPSTSRPLGGASLRIWAKVENPNAFGLTLAALTGNVVLDNQRAADVNFPLGIPMMAGGDTIIPLDVTINFSDVPALATMLKSAVTRNRVAYRLEGTVTLDAAPFGRPSFGPSTWLSGETPIVR